MKRRELSRPLRLAIEDGLLGENRDLFDYGCGRGDDLRILRERGVRCSGWDPAYQSDATIREADVVNLGYVVNVIENPAERGDALKGAWAITKDLLIVSAQLIQDARATRQERFEDGYVTRFGTFQKYFEQHELRSWIDQALGKKSVPAAPGVFYVFRDEAAAQSFSASRYRRRLAAPHLRRSDEIFERHKELLEPLIAFVMSRGRVPDSSEMPSADAICREFGSLGRAFSVIRRATGGAAWEEVRSVRAQELLIHLALNRFGGRPKYSQLDLGMQLDVKAFYSTYTRACSLADELLFSAGNMDVVGVACRKSPVGKVTPNSLYVHTSAIPHLPPILRVYEGCARAYVGNVVGANLIKLHQRWPQVSYLCYPRFERDPHPALFASLVVPLRTFHIQYREYGDSDNPPILHRKETFLDASNPLRSRFECLTKQEERYGLYENVQTIGTREGWETALTQKGVLIKGHKAVKAEVLSILCK
jgi:DNA phosphorothioation-associated putative methyltransferase